MSEKLRVENFKVQTSLEVPSTMGDPILKTFDVFFIVTAGESCSRRSRIGLRWSNRLLVISQFKNKLYAHRYWNSMVSEAVFQ